jgi:hypothetical protein
MIDTSKQAGIVVVVLLVGCKWLHRWPLLPHGNAA